MFTIKEWVVVILLSFVWTGIIILSPHLFSSVEEQLPFSSVQVNVSDKYVHDPKTEIDYVIIDNGNGMVYRTNKLCYNRLLKGYTYQCNLSYQDFIIGVNKGV
jgi:hypothetical protein